MKKINFFILTALLFLGAQSAWALVDGNDWATGCDGAYVYFDNSNTSYNGVSLVMGRQWNWDKGSAGSTGYAMSAITNTKLYYFNGNLYDHFTTMCFVNRNGGSGWNDYSSSAVATRVTTYAANYTNSYNSSISSDKYYLYVAANDAVDGNNNSITRTEFSKSYSNFNHTQTIAQTYNNGSSNVAPAVSLANIVVSGYAFSNYNTCGAIASPNSFTAGDAYSAAKTNAAGYTSTITLQVSNVIAGFTFDGFYNAQGTKLASSESDGVHTCSYVVTQDSVITARFNRAEYSRSVSTGYGTICLPWPATIQSDEPTDATVEIYTIAGPRKDNENKTVAIVLEPVAGTLTAGAPYIYKATTSGNMRFTYGTTTAVAGTNDGLVGTYVATTVDNGYYVIYDGEIRKVNGATVTCGANKAYIDMVAVEEKSPAAPGLGRLELPMEPSTTTAIDNIEANEQAVKFVKEGKLFIKKNGVVYDLTGRAVK